jgi:hypothetical protein
MKMFEFFNEIGACGDVFRALYEICNEVNSAHRMEKAGR